ncbi:MAG: SoxR reducing system RseC family protein [Christensenellales bacterium]
MKEIGTVVRLEQNKALVLFERSSACQSCGRCQRAEGAHMQVWLPNTKQAEVGDKVCVELGARGMLRATWLAYIFPLVMLFVGVAAGYFPSARKQPRHHRCVCRACGRRACLYFAKDKQ